MEKEIYLRLLRRICTAVLALLLAVMISGPVLADETDAKGEPAAEDALQQEQVLTEENFAAVAAQLEAVAREEGRSIADKMLYESFRTISPLSAPVEAEASAEPTAAPAQDAPSVIVHSAEKQVWSFSGLLPFFAVVAVVIPAMFAVFRSLRRRSGTGRRIVFSRGYRPMRDRTFREETFERRNALRLYR